MQIRERLVRIISLIAIVVGVLVIIGWWLDLPLLKSVISGLPSMKVSTALCFIFSGAALFSCSRYISGRSELPQIVIPFLILGMSLIMLTFFVTGLVHIESGLEYLFIEEVDLVQGVYMRPSIGTMISFLIIIIMITNILFNTLHKKRIVKIGGAVMMCLGLVSILGFILKMPVLYWDFQNISNAMAISTSVLFVLLGLGFINVIDLPQVKSTVTQLKTKIIITIVASIILPTLFVSLLAFSNLRIQNSNQAVMQLETIAKMEEVRINDAIQKYQLIAKGISSRTTLRQELIKFSETQDQKHRENIYNISKDAVEPFDEVKGLALFDSEGALVIIAPQSEQFTTYNTLFGLRNGDKLLAMEDTNGHSLYLFETILDEEQNVIGTVILNFGQQLFDMVTSNNTGLGNSGEMVLAFKNADGDAEFFTRPRFMRVSNIVNKDKTHVPITQAILGVEKTYKAAEDYRGIEVVAVTRYIDETGWGFVVKMDKEEIFSPTRNFILTLSIINLIVILFSLIVIYSIPKKILGSYNDVPPSIN